MGTPNSTECRPLHNPSNWLAPYEYEDWLVLYPESGRPVKLNRSAMTFIDSSGEQFTLDDMFYYDDEEIIVSCKEELINIRIKNQSPPKAEIFDGKYTLCYTYISPQNDTGHQCSPSRQDASHQSGGASDAC